jgi:septal ring factor EnvC (AmiA/AmiB activator)
MVKRLKILVVTLLLSFISFSQNDTIRICLPYLTAQKIAIELVQKDSLNAELKATQKILKETQTTLKFQDSVIVSFEKKEIEYKSEIKIFEEKEKNYKEKTTKLEKDIFDLNRKNNNLKTGIKWISGGFVASILTILTLVTIK